MSKFVVGVIVGFLACVWAIQTTPLIAFSALVQRLEEVHETSANAHEAYKVLLHSKQTKDAKELDQSDGP